MGLTRLTRALYDFFAIKRINNKHKNKTNAMSPSKQSGSKTAGLVVAAGVTAATACVVYYHKDMTKEELREAGEKYLAKTQEVSAAAIEGAKPYVAKAAEKTQEASVAAYQGAKPYVIAVGEKTVEVSKDLYAKIVALIFPDGEQETSEDTQDVTE